jgi:hypothetical protein
MHDCARLCGIPLGRQRRDRLRLQDRSQQGQLTSTEDNGIQKLGNPFARFGLSGEYRSDGQDFEREGWGVAQELQQERHNNGGNPSRGSRRQFCETRFRGECWAIRIGD